MKNLTPEQYAELSAQCVKHYKAEVFDDTNSAYKYAKHVIGTVSDIKNPAFAYGDAIFIPRMPGLAPAARFAVLCHELQHVRQWRSDPLFLMHYVWSKYKRARIETSAFCVQMEVEYLTTGNIQHNAGECANMLRAYNVGRVNVALCKRTLIKRARNILVHQKIESSIGRYIQRLVGELELGR